MRLKNYVGIVTVIVTITVMATIVFVALIETYHFDILLLIQLLLDPQTFEFKHKPTWSEASNFLFPSNRPCSLLRYVYLLDDII